MTTGRTSPVVVVVSDRSVEVIETESGRGCRIKARRAKI